MTRMVGALLAGILLTGALFAGRLAISGNETTLANPGVGLGIDANPSGNTATTLGTIEPCVRIGTNQTAQIDVFITDVTDLLVWHVLVGYDTSKMNIVDRNVQLFAAAGAGSALIDFSDGDPGLGGAYDLMVSEDSEPPVVESGSGVLARLTVRGMAPGVIALTLGDPRLFGTPLPRQITVGSITNAWIAVDQACPSEPPPTSTPGPTVEPTPSSTTTSTPGPTTTPTPSSTPTPGTPTPTPPPGTVILVAGWNDVCYQGPARPIGEALADWAGHVGAVYRMRPGQGFDHWFPTRPELSTIENLSPYDQLFILATEPTVWTHEPVSPPASASLVGGWNGVCYPGPDREVEPATASISGKFALLYTLASDQAWRRFAPGRPEASNLSLLRSRTAVLILVTDSGGAQWVFGP